MGRHLRRAAGVALAGVLLVGVLARPAAAADSTTEALIEGLNQQLLAVAVPITLLVEGILFYTVWRFRKSEDPLPTQENRRLEIAWTLATALILLWVGFSGYTVLAEGDVTTPENAAPEGDDVHVDAVAYQWGWKFVYPERGVTFNVTGEDSPALVIPADREVFFDVTSLDVLHAFHVPELGLKQDAVPGEVNRIKTTPTDPGNTYQGYCAEYCGLGHSNMLFTVRVVPSEEYEAWIEQRRAAGDTVDVSATNASNASAGGA